MLQSNWNQRERWWGWGEQWQSCSPEPNVWKYRRCPASLSFKGLGHFSSIFKTNWLLVWIIANCLKNLPLKITILYNGPVEKLMFHPIAFYPHTTNPDQRNVSAPGLVQNRPTISEALQMGLSNLGQGQRRALGWHNAKLQGQEKISQIPSPCTHPVSPPFFHEALLSFALGTRTSEQLLWSSKEGTGGFTTQLCHLANFTSDN